MARGEGGVGRDRSVISRSRNALARHSSWRLVHPGISKDGLLKRCVGRSRLCKSISSVNARATGSSPVAPKADLKKVRAFL